MAALLTMGKCENAILHSAAVMRGLVTRVASAIRNSTRPSNLACSAALIALVSQSEIAAANPQKPRVLILTDAGNEVDDQESLVRLLLYANEFDIEGLVATTSTWMPDQIHPELIEERVRAYGTVLPNLQKHASGYPSMATLLDSIRSGSAKYGMAGVGKGKETPGSRLIIQLADNADPRPLWIASWGGVADLAEALWTVQHTRSSAAVAKFVSRLRVYTISDQDDAGPWARATFPRLWWETSIHPFNDYNLATWPGMSEPAPGSNTMVVSHSWIEEHIRKGPLGLLYPQYMYGMEGDTPSFLNLIDNGLSDPNHPDWGGWGGRYGQLADNLGLWASASDNVVTKDGTTHTGASVSVWRWREAYQSDFAARVLWSLTPDYKGANHNPNLVVNGLHGSAPVKMTVCVGQNIKLTAAGSSDPDGDAVHYRWWYYGDADRTMPSPGTDVTVTQVAAEAAEIVVGPAKVPSIHVGAPASRTFHIILEATDSGSPQLTSYRRVVLTAPSSGTNSARQNGCD